MNYSRSNIDDYIDKFEDTFKNDDESIRMIIKKWPNNTEFEQVLAKMCVINSLYSAGVRKKQLCGIATYISKISDLDKKINSGDMQAFYDISNTSEDLFNVPVFASKFCHFHNPKKFPIYDKFSRKALAYINRIEKFSGLFEERDIQDYRIYKEKIDLYLKVLPTKYNYKKIDQFLWLYGYELEKENKKKRI